MTHKQAEEFRAMKKTIMVMADQMGKLIGAIKYLQEEAKLVRAHPALSIPPLEVPQAPL